MKTKSLLVTLFGMLLAGGASAAGEPEDVRVAPMMDGFKWGQSTDTGYDDGLPCFNYYTPGNTYCGCAAAALAQVMRYWKHPTATLPVTNVFCAYEGTGVVYQIGGWSFDFDAMPRDPSAADVTEAQRAAIGLLTYDYAVATESHFATNGATLTSSFLAFARLKERYGFASVEGVGFRNPDLSTSINEYSEEKLKEAVIPSLDYGAPVVLSAFETTDEGHYRHFFVVDGYGFDSDGTFRIHALAGDNLAGDWFAPPNFPVNGHTFTQIGGCYYSILPNETGVIASGRVLDSTGAPVSGALVTLSDGESVRATTTTTEKGLYALLAPAAGTWSLQASSQGKNGATNVTLAANATTQITANYAFLPETMPVVGNRYGLDITLKSTYDVTTATPVFTPAGTKSFALETNTVISCATPGAVIRYTLDGTDPTTKSPRYNGETLTFYDTTTVKARAWANQAEASAIATATFTYNAKAAVPAGDTFARAIPLRGTSGTYRALDYGRHTTDSEGLHAIADDYLYAECERHAGWFSWTAPGTGHVTFKATITGSTVYGDEYDYDNWAVIYNVKYQPYYCTMAAAFSGDSPGEADRLARDGKPYTDETATLSFDVEQGKTYRVLTMASYNIYDVQDDPITNNFSAWNWYCRYQHDDWITTYFNPSAAYCEISWATSGMIITNTEGTVERASESRLFFSGNGGQVNENAVTATNGLPLPVLTGSFTPTRTGYDFTGYYNTASSGRQYYSADRTAAVDTWDRDDENVILYAQWKPHTYTIRFKANGGEGEMADLACTYGVKAILTPNGFKRKGYAFSGWKRAGLAETLANKQSVENLVSDDGAVVELEAQWTEVPLAEAIAFETEALAVEKGGVFELVVNGGRLDAACRVKVSVAYASAKASDLDLANATVTGADGVERTGLTFPLTLTWAEEEVEAKKITIPTTAGKTTDAGKGLLWKLSDGEGLELGKTVRCRGLIGKGSACKTDEVYVLPLVSDEAGGKVSGGASSKADAKGAFKTVTLKATANKGYWFAGWYDAAGTWIGGDLSLKAAPDNGASPLVWCEARFVKEHPSLLGTYNGFAGVDLKGMTLVKGATPPNVTNACPFTATVAKDGKMSGTVTVGGKKVSFKADGCCEASEEDDLSAGTWATYRFSADEKLWFGKSNVETLQITFERERSETAWKKYGAARLDGVSTAGDYAPLGAEQSGFAYRATDKADLDLFKPFIGTYATAISMEGGELIPLSFSVDKSGKIKATGFYTDGTSLALTGTLTLWSSEPTLGIAHLFATPKALGSGSLCVCISLSAADDGSVSCLTTAQATSYSATCCQDSDVYYAYAHAFTPGCWIPDGADPDYGVVRLTSGTEAINILYASKNGAVTGLGKPLESGFTVKFDAKTGLLTVAKGKTYSIYGVLQDRKYSSKAIRINAGGSHDAVTVSFEKLPEPDETFPWTSDGFSLTVGQNAGDGVQPSVTSEGKALALTVSGLPSGLKYDAKTGLITGAPTKAATSTVKITYTYCGRKITRTTTFVVSAKPDGLPLGTYTGLAELNLSGGDDRLADYPFTATLDKNGALSGSITLFGKKATLKASGYDTCTEGLAVYTATLDLKAVDKTWGAANVSLAVESDTLTNIGSPTLGGTHGLKRIEAYRNQTKDAGFAARVAPCAGTYLLSFATTRAGTALGETVLSVTVDKKGTVKAAGTFADGTALSASTTLWLAPGDSEALACVAVVPKTFGAGSLALNLAFALNDGKVTVKAEDCDLLGAAYVLKSQAYTAYALGEDGLTVGYSYASGEWIDRQVRPTETCLAVTSEVFAEDALFAWTVKNSAIAGVGKTTNKSKVTFTLNDKTGIFTGKFGTYSFFGAMRKGTCSGTGTIVGKDGTVRAVHVGVRDL